MSLADAAAKYPFKPFVFGTRTSSGFGGSLKKTKERLDAVVEEVRQRYPRRPVIRGPGEKGQRLYGREQGYINIPRPILLRGVKVAKESGGILLYPSRNRVIRNATDRNAMPTDDEFLQLENLASGIVIATVIDPEANDDEQQRAAVKQGGAGPKKHSNEVTGKILALVGRQIGTKEKPRWETSVRKVAERTPFTKSTVDRVLDEKVPVKYVPPDFDGDPNNCRWKDLKNPLAVFRVMYLDGVP